MAAAAFRCHHDRKSLTFYATVGFLKLSDGLFRILSPDKNLSRKPAQQQKYRIILKLPLGDKTYPGKSQIQQRQHIQRRAVINNKDGRAGYLLSVQLLAESDAADPKNRMDHQGSHTFKDKIGKLAQRKY